MFCTVIRNYVFPWQYHSINSSTQNKRYINLARNSAVKKNTLKPEGHRRCRYNVTLRRVMQPLLQWKSKWYSCSEGVCL